MAPEKLVLKIILCYFHYQRENKSYFTRKPVKQAFEAR